MRGKADVREKEEGEEDERDRKGFEGGEGGSTDQRITDRIRSSKPGFQQEGHGCGKQKRESGEGGSPSYSDVRFAVLLAFLPSALFPVVA